MESTLEYWKELLAGWEEDLIFAQRAVETAKNDLECKEFYCNRTREQIIDLREKVSKMEAQHA